MMFTKTKLLAWLVVILLVTNMSAILSFVYHTKHELRLEQPGQSIEIPGEQRTRFFKEELNLTPEQVERFRIANRQFNQQARKITSELEYLRSSLIEEMIRENPAQARLDQLAKQIGQQHTQLKVATYNFYLDLKELCNGQQQEKLATIFKSLISADQNIQLPRGRGGKNRWR